MLLKASEEFPFRFQAFFPSQETEKEAGHLGNLPPLLLSHLREYGMGGRSEGGRGTAFSCFELTKAGQWGEWVGTVYLPQRKVYLSGHDKT